MVLFGACSPHSKLICGFLICTTTCPILHNKRKHSKISKGRDACRKFSQERGVIMKKVYNNCCGIDVHKKLMVACFIHGKEQEVREFGTTIRELLELADWLTKGGCQMVAMKSTTSYWKPMYNILAFSSLETIVVNARIGKLFQEGIRMLRIPNGSLTFCSMTFYNLAIFPTGTSVDCESLSVTVKV